MSNAVDASELSEKRAFLEPCPNLIGRNTRLEQLASRNNAVRATREGRQNPFYGAGFWGHRP